MSQETNANSYMNRRCEPMGGELDTTNKNVPNVGRLNNFPDSSSEDTFIDELTLKVRSLLKSWDDDFMNDDLSNNHQLHDSSSTSHSTLGKEFQLEKSTVSSGISLISSKRIPECLISNELKCLCNDSKFNSVESFSGNPPNDSKASDFGSFTHEERLRTLTNLEGNIKEASKCSTVVTEEKSQNRSELKDDRFSNRPRTSVKEISNYDMDDTLLSFKKTSTPIPTVEDPVSYNDFSNSLQDVRSTSGVNKKNSNDPFNKSGLESSRKLSVSERSSKIGIGNLKPSSTLNAFTSTDMYSRDSSDKETERSWSEITIVAESYSESSKNRVALPIENRNDFCSANSPQPSSFEKPPKALTSCVRVKENIKNVSRPSNIYSKDSDVNSRNWRIEITDLDKTSQEPDKVYQFSDFLPNSNLSDLDQIDRDTPPLSASSMASSKRLEWDNGADIGYNVADMRTKVKYRSIPRSEPEGISFINETGTNAASSKVILPNFASMSSQGEPTSMVSSRLDGLSSETSSVHEPSVMEVLLDQSSSPGSLSRSDSKKSVIYNSFKNSLACGKANSSTDLSFTQTRKNSSWPDLTLKKPVPIADWQAVSPSKMLSKSDELVSLVRYSELRHKQSHFPAFKVSGININESTDSSHLPERILPIGDYFPSESQSVPKLNFTGSMSHSCKSCQSSFSGNVTSSAGELINQKSGDLYNLQEGDLESYEMDSESPNVNQTNDSSQFSHHGAEGDWTNENVLNSDFSYVTELSELTDYQLQSFTSRPFLLLHHDSSKLKGSNFPNIVQNLFRVSNTDHSTSGNLEVKPHIRWYPFPSSSNLQDIKNVSTQTSVSFVAKQQTDSPVQVSDQQMNLQDMSSKARGLRLGGNSSKAQLNKPSAKILDNSDFASASMISKTSAVNNKGTVQHQISLNERSNTSILDHSHITSEVAMTVSKNSSSDVNQVDHKIYLSKQLDSLDRNLSSSESGLSRKSEKEKKLPLLTHSFSSVVTSNKSAQYQPSAFFSDTRYDSDDSTKNLISQSPSKYIFSGDPTASFAKRRVGVGQCQTSLEPACYKIPREKLRIQPDMQTKTRNSSTENLNDSTEKNESVLHSSKDFIAIYSNSEFSRFVSNHLDTEAVNYDHSQNSYKNLDDTVPLNTAYSQSGTETIRNGCNVSSTVQPENITLNLNEKVNSIMDYDRRLADVTSDATNLFIQRESNLSELLSEIHPFSMSRQHENSIIHKSYSDPLISFQNSKPNVVCEKDGTFLQSRLPSVNRKLDFELSGDSETDSSERMIDCVQTSFIKHSNISDNPEWNQLQNNVSSNLRGVTASNSFFYERGSLGNKSPVPAVSNIIQSSNFSSEIPKLSSDSQKSLLKERSYLFSRNKMEKPSLQKSFEHSDVVDEVHQIPTDNVLSRLKYSEFNKKNYASVGIQVSQSVSGLERCSFCHKSKDSHMNCCLKKEAFKTVLNQTLAKRVPERKFGTSFCVYPSGCYCCCNKTLQEAFNFHRSEIVERIELRQKEVEEKCKKKFLQHAPSTLQNKSKQPVVKLNMKSVSDVHGRTGKNISNKENKRIKKSESSWKSTSSQKGRQRNLTKYNRIMSKIYSQRLKNETLKGKVSHQRHEILINS